MSCACAAAAATCPTNADNLTWPHLFCSCTEANLSGPVPLPTRIRKYTVLRSPHVNKDSREQFETRTHQRLIDIRDPSPAMIDSLMDLDLPAGVDLQVKLQ